MITLRRGQLAASITCVAVPPAMVTGSALVALCKIMNAVFQKGPLWPNLRSNRQLKPPLPLNFACRIFRNSALAPNFTSNPLFGKADMGSLMHSHECSKATAVSEISFHPDLGAER